MKRLTPLGILFLIFVSSVLAQADLPQDGLRHHFTFDDANNLEVATVGNNLVRGNLDTATPLFNTVSGHSGGDGAVEVGLGSFYRLNLDFEPNGSDTATRVNEFTFVIDFYLPQTDVWYAFHSARNDGDPTADDWDSFIRKSDMGLGVGATGYSIYSVKEKEWYRLVISADLGTEYKYYLDGQIAQIADDIEAIGIDGRFSLPSADGVNQVLFFGDESGEDANIYISQLAVYDRPLTEEEVYSLGGWDHIIPLRDPFGLWLFDDPSDITLATNGIDLTLVGTHESVDGPESQDYAVRIGQGSYYEANPNIYANGGGERVNQYTLIMDCKYPELGSWYALMQTDPTNASDGDLFISPEGKLGVGDLEYTDSVLTANDWYRLIMTVDLGGEGVKFFLDGDSVHFGGVQEVDNRFSLAPKLGDNKVLFFADENGEDNTIEVSYLGIYNRILSEDEIIGLGGYDHGPENTEATGSRKAVYFNGSDYSNRYGKIQKTNDNFNFGEGDFTIELWTKPDVGYDSDPSLVSDKDWTSGSHPGWIISIRANDNDWKFNAGDQNGNRYDVNGPDINDGNWHHIAVIANQDSGIKLITDDLETVWATDGGDFFNVENIDNSEMPICVAQDGTEQYGDGPPAPAQVDELRIYKGVAVEPEVIYEWRHKQVTEDHPYYSNLVGYWRFNEGEGTTVADESGNGHDMELVGNPKWVVSYAALTDDDSNAGYKNEVSAVWGGQSSATSGGLTIGGSFPVERGFSISKLGEISEVMDDKADNPYAVFGHNDGEGATVDANAGVEARLVRIWNVDVTETAFTNTSLTFDLNALGGSTAAGAAANYVLLSDNGSGFGAVAGISVEVDGDNITFTGVTLEDAIYSLGTTNLTDSPLGGMVVGVEDNDGLPTEFALENNYPNPFNPSTTIRFALPISANVKLAVYNILGEKVTELINEELNAGYHSVEWNSVVSCNVASGIYVYQLTASGSNGNQFVQTKKMMLIK
ncbi:MAG: DUF4983 domain-containing protein [Ignavibacteria bacterium]|jgi:hypothetical protein